MTTQEIKALVAAKIAGQGNQIDLGNALPEIIDALCDAVDSAPKAVVVTETLSSTPIEITGEQYLKYLSAGILLYEGFKFLICSNLIDEQLFSAYQWENVQIFAKSIILTDGGGMDAYTAIIIGPRQGKFYIAKIEL